MALDGAWNAYIFREGKSPVRSSELLDGLNSALLAFADVASENKRTALLDLLIRAGELEGALLDASCSHAAAMATIADAVALSLVSRHSLCLEDLSAHACVIKAPEQLTVTPPEGFAYYALHPLDFADLAKSVASSGQYAAVIGIRSIGTTLSAVVQAALHAEGVCAQRTTVRPTGHPYDRRTEFSPEQLRWIRAMQSHRAEFFVVDEGPGMSGSSFLSVGDALLSAGVPRQRIVFLCSRDPYPPSLTAPNAAERWPAYRSYCTRSTRHLPKGADEFVAGGIWRAHVYDDPQQWPASWLQMERLKFFSSAGDAVYKFEGHGRFGKAVHARSIRVAEGGFGPLPLRFEEGFSVYPRLGGKPLNKQCASPGVLEHLARYCCFRAQNMLAESSANAELEKMLFFNVKQEFGIDLATGDSELRVVKLVIADGRMSPHKWFDVNGALLKVDSSIHGDDHFFPGPTDIAWDLAGVIVEWDLDARKAAFFLDCYQRESGDNPQRRLPAYLLAYSIFRMAFCKMASASMEGSEEEPRLLRDYHYYRAQACRYVPTAAKPVTVTQFSFGEKSPEARLA
jgi:hypothetical protein